MSDEQTTREYSNGEVVIEWRSARCSHSATCIRGLPAVFDTRRRPWIDVAAASTAEIVAQVRRCPSGALAYRMEAGHADPSAVPEAAPAAPSRLQVTVRPNGPLLLDGPLRLTLPDGTTLERDGKTALCRCGASANKPLCDGSHGRVGFNG